MKPWLVIAVFVSACGAPPPVGDGGQNNEPFDAGRPADAGVALDAGVRDAGVTPRCTVTGDAVTCPATITNLTAGTASRDVYWQLPVTPPPSSGYPVVVLFQGSFFGPSTTWGTVSNDVAFGGYQQARLQALLLERGFAVVAPSAAIGLAWQTNSGVPWALTTDSTFIEALFDAMSRGDYGPLDANRWYATGISSGGYMTSRMALSYPGRFRALAVHSGSWATCAGPVCLVPSSLPSDHPPTLLLHGRKDLTVPLFTAEKYFDELKDDGFVTELEIEDDASHEWLPVAPERVTAWFEAH
ncbi:MAG: hypothetical protein DI536_10535 [Archangium gephyra]|uniref:Uncharacterized protein n=1 Tax=Archangium gephyra TaxID=48 RepID=A0A2W5VEG4_9BACT|nr:MAG: hypothetical protein DI536_10535 [Archangium gephyra]